MWTIGVDIASENSRTAICCIDWGGSGAKVVHLRVDKMTNKEIIEEIQTLRSAGQPCDIGIDAPFSFPISFLNAVQAMAKGKTPPGTTDVWRLTEQYLKSHLSIQPLSSTASLITNTVTGRCLPVRYALAGSAYTDLLGYTTRIFEVYPASALISWKVPVRAEKGEPSYKQSGSAGDKARECVLKHLFGTSTASGSGSWLHVPSPSPMDLLCATDDAIDALVCALVAKIAGDPGRPTEPAKTHPFTRAELKQIKQEGWIHVPPFSSLKALSSASRGASVSIAGATANPSASIQQADGAGASGVSDPAKGATPGARASGPLPRAPRPPETPGRR